MRQFVTTTRKPNPLHRWIAVAVTSIVSLGIISCNDQAASVQTLQVRAVSPFSSTLAAGDSITLVAQGTLSDGQELDITDSVLWSSSDPTIATVSSASGQKGMVTGVAKGKVTITASFLESDHSLEQSLSLEVTEARLKSIQINPLYVVLEKGNTQQYKATGVYSDGHTADLTAQATWSSSNPQIAISPTGMATMNGLGNTNIKAQVGGFVSAPAVVVAVNAHLASIELTTKPAGITNLPSGIPLQYLATGTFSDGASLDLTSVVTWSSSVTRVATISNLVGQKGIATGITPGMTTIRAAWENIQAATSLQITEATLKTIDVTAPAEQVASGKTVFFKAMGTFSDGSSRDLSSQVTWGASPPEVAAIDGNGVLTTKSKGISNVTATLNGISGSKKLVVTDAILDSIEVASVPAMITSVPKGLSVQYVAIGHFSDGTTQDISSLVSWSVDNATVASISNKSGSRGLLITGSMGMGVGTVVVTASQGTTLMTSTTLRVTNAVLKTIDVSPSGGAMAKGTQQAMKAMGFYSDGTTMDLTASVQWTAVDVPGTGMNVATFYAMDPAGTVTGKNVGKSKLTATMPMTLISGSTEVTVTDERLVSIAVKALVGGNTVTTGASKPFVAIGTFSDSSTQEITSSVSWSSSDKSILTVTDAPGDHGIVTGVTAGSAQVIATWKSITSPVSGSATVSVTP